MAEIQFRKYTAEDASTFKTLNVEWLEMYFEVEPIDERVLSNPQTAIPGKVSTAPRPARIPKIKRIFNNKAISANIPELP